MKKQPARPKGIDDLVANCDPAARGIVQCLRMLAEEADSLRLPGTRRALKQAMATCAAESHDLRDDKAIVAQSIPPGTAVH